MDNNKKFLAIREGGQTQRCHTMQYIHPYNVAIHSYNALSLLLVLHPNPSVNLIKAVLWHDVPERWTGDVPSPAKWASTNLKEALDLLEQKILIALDISDAFQQLTKEELQWLTAVDLLELWVWGKEQFQLGNTDMQTMLMKVWYKVLDCGVQEGIDFMNNFEWQRCDEIL